MPSILTRSPHITIDGRPKLSEITQAKLNIIKMAKDRVLNVVLLKILEAPGA
jgi:hypothetical protein